MIRSIGWIGQDGYWYCSLNGSTIKRAILIVEEALGKKLPLGSIVHHVDEVKQNDSNENLVVCPSLPYHRLIHARTLAYDACGHADWVQCYICNEWHPVDLSHEGNEHIKCRRMRSKMKRLGIL